MSKSNELYQDKLQKENEALDLQYQEQMQAHEDERNERKIFHTHMDEIKLAAENLLDIINNPYKPR
jgi:hypothetical protein